ncbi:hypothetical protein CTAM01_14361 [Colletotrichum tamarilloi]|uniref:Uncharacterized protein n=1 Tax=Colletotrichum tamarilloi TaxID=1209934 RepID=A0ABQ9QPH0_9PEZI|nr:uncharacterized protein CTAM01_14361 [Colletotrichum tamarilloi]KAI3545657.1 hypothetical protein CSPX01_04963 [Colletotrichum filicis]KAK1480521.1 hypothetical protein CTAM01_14361 [Colletotrichum tamarilloi]
MSSSSLPDQPNGCNGWSNDGFDATEEEDATTTTSKKTAGVFNGALVRPWAAGSSLQRPGTSRRQGLGVERALGSWEGDDLFPFLARVRTEMEKHDACPCAIHMDNGAGPLPTVGMARR